MCWHSELNEHAELVFTVFPFCNNLYKNYLSGFVRECDTVAWIQMNHNTDDLKWLVSLCVSWTCFWFHAVYWCTIQHNTTAHRLLLHFKVIFIYHWKLPDTVRVWYEIWIYGSFTRLQVQYYNADRCRQMCPHFLIWCAIYYHHRHQGLYYHQTKPCHSQNIALNQQILFIIK